MKHLLAILVALLCTAPLIEAKITTAKIRKDVRLNIDLTEPFGFGEDGRIKITISNFKVYPYWRIDKEKARTPKLDRLGVFLTIPEYEGQIEYDEIEKQICPLDERGLEITLFDFDDFSDPDTDSISREIVLNKEVEDYQGGNFVLYFANCQPEIAVDFDVHIEMYNVKPNGAADYLPLGDDALPLLYFFFFLIFAGLGIVWTGMVLKGRQYAHRLHVLMIALVAFKSLTLLSQAGMYHMISVYGDAEGWNVAYYFFTAARGLLFFLVVVLIATGWSYMKPFLADREKQILLIVLPLQVFANVALVVLDEYTPAFPHFSWWNGMLHFVNIICFAAILFPIIWSIKQMREAAEIDGKAARSLSKLVLFRQFYIMVVAYIYFTQIIVVLLELTLPYKHMWVAKAANEIATLAFYVACGLIFQPAPEGTNPYLALDLDDIELVGR
jgi:hypothetical protein